MKADDNNPQEGVGGYEDRKMGLVPSNFNFINLEEIKSTYGEPPWEHPLVRTDLIWASLHCMPPGMKTRVEYHDNSDECWAVLEGEIQWEIEGIGTLRAKPGDFVFCEHGRAHRMQTVGDRQSIRLAFVLPHPDPFAADPSRLRSSKQQQPSTDSQDIVAKYYGKFKHAKRSEYDEMYADEDLQRWKNRKVGLMPANLNFSNLEVIKEAYGEPPWEHPLVRTDLIWVTLMCTPPGVQMPAEYHENADECWTVMEGEMEWEIEGFGTVRAKPGDFVFCEHGHAHRMRTVGDKPSIRLAFVMPWPDQLKPDLSRLPSTRREQLERDPPGTD